MITANEKLQDALIRHQTFLLRYSSYVRNRIAALLNRSEDDIADKIISRLANNEGLRTTAEWSRLQALIASIATLRGKAWDQVNEFWLNDSVDLAYQEPIIMQGIFSTTAPVVIETVLPSQRLLKNIALSRPFEGKTLKEWSRTMQTEDLRRMGNAIQLGMVAGEDSGTIARRVFGTGGLKGSDGVTEMTRRQVQTITRTAVQQIANNARNEFLEENAEVITAEQFVATLDARTSAVCRAYDGKRFEPGKGPKPPLHFNCRSLRVAAYDGERLGNRPAKASTQRQLLDEYANDNKLPKLNSRDDIPRGMKTDFDSFSRSRIRELTGPIPASTTYQTWLQKQSKSFQDEVLGMTKAKLFREGGLTLDKFVDRNGTELNLSQLATKNADAFRAAGLDPVNFK